MKSLVHIDNKKKNILIVGLGLTQGLDDTTLTAETQYSINFSRSNRKFCLSLHYKESNSFLFVNAMKNISIQSKRFWNKKYPLGLENISGLNGCVYDFPVDYKTFDTSDIFDINKYLIKKLNITQCLGLLKKCLLDYWLA